MNSSSSALKVLKGEFTVTTAKASDISEVHAIIDLQ